jgi:hypothetical protein
MKDEHVYLLSSLRFWAGELRRDPLCPDAHRMLSRAATEAREAGLELPPDLPELRPDPLELACQLDSISRMLDSGLAVVWRDARDAVREELPRLRNELKCLRLEVARLQDLLELYEQGRRP